MNFNSRTNQALHFSPVLCAVFLPFQKIKHEKTLHITPR